MYTCPVYFELNYITCLSFIFNCLELRLVASCFFFFIGGSGGLGQGNVLCFHLSSTVNLYRDFYLIRCLT